MTKLTINDLDVKNKTVFLRVDFNVPLNSDNTIADTSRIDLSLPTINNLISRGAKLAIVSHLGRPNGVEEKYSLSQVANYLSQKLASKVYFCTSILGDIAKKGLAQLKAGDCLMFENIRFYEDETKCTELFCREIAKNFDLYVNDAFGTAHRAHASTYGIAKHFKNAACGFLMEKEINALQGLITLPSRPFVAILGGAKVKDKIKVILNLIKLTDHIIIGGGMAYTFLKQLGMPIGKSIYDLESVGVVNEILNYVKVHKKLLHLPVDHVVDINIDGLGAIESTIADNQFAFDIGPKTINNFNLIIESAAQVFWNGPMGVFEKKPFQKGTFAIAKALNNCNGYTVVGGGDSLSAIYQSGYTSNIDHISTGGGASLELLEGAVLPGVEILADKII